MDFRLTAEQRILRDAMARYARGYLEGRRARLANPDVRSLGAWREMSALGWPGVGFPEDLGGHGGGPVEEMLIHAGAGAALAVEPLLAVRLACHCLALAAAPDRRQTLLTPVLAGDRVVVLAHDEADARGDVSRVEASALPIDGAGYSMSGHKAVAHGAPQADVIMVSANIPGGGLALFMLGAADIFPRMRVCRTVDGFSAADIDLDGFIVAEDRLIACGDPVASAVALAFDRVAICACADAVGAMDATLSLTVRHLGTREQFGAKLGSFQALQHRLADMVIAVEQARSMMLYGLAALTVTSADERARGVSAAMVRVIDSSRAVAASAVQLHGGIGVTEEHIVSHYFRRLTAFANRFGGKSRQLARFSSHL